MSTKEAVEHGYAYTRSRWRVPFTDDAVDLAAWPTLEKLPKEEAGARLEAAARRVGEAQQVLYARDIHAVLVVLQGMDTSGKDGTIRRVFRWADPAGVNVTSFKRPTSRELEHDFLWRCQAALPRRGEIGVFNRSHYEDVLVVKVHPELLELRRLRSRRFPQGGPEDVWARRYRAIRAWERHLADSGVVVVKVMMHLSKEEQRKRLLARLDDPAKHWKFEDGDVVERGFWDAYQRAYADALAATSRPWAPWYVVPADHKPTARALVAEVIADTLDRLGLTWPVVSDERREMLGRIGAALRQA